MRGESCGSWRELDKSLGYTGRRNIKCPIFSSESQNATQGLSAVHGHSVFLKDADLALSVSQRTERWNVLVDVITASLSVLFPIMLSVRPPAMNWQHWHQIRSTLKTNHSAVCKIKCLFAPRSWSESPFTASVRKLMSTLHLETNQHVLYIINTNVKKKLWSFPSDAKDIYRVGTEVHNSRCPTLTCPYSSASWVVVYIDELWRDIV